MFFPEIIDLHMHSKFSDGTDTPEEILDRVKEAGIDFFSITDHDSVKAGPVIQRNTQMRRSCFHYGSGVFMQGRDPANIMFWDTDMIPELRKYRGWS